MIRTWADEQGSVQWKKTRLEGNFQDRNKKCLSDQDRSNWVTAVSLGTAVAQYWPVDSGNHRALCRYITHLKLNLTRWRWHHIAFIISISWISSQNINQEQNDKILFLLPPQFIEWYLYNYMCLSTPDSITKKVIEGYAIPPSHQLIAYWRHWLTLTELYILSSLIHVFGDYLLRVFNMPSTKLGIDREMSKALVQLPSRRRENITPKEHFKKMRQLKNCDKCSEGVKQRDFKRESA